MKESYSDFSIIKSYLELKEKYDKEIKNFSDGSKVKEEQFKKQSTALEAEVAKRNEYIKAQEKKIQELTQKIAEKDEQLKTLGLQLHKLKLSQSPSEQQSSTEDTGKKRGLFK